MARKTKTWMPPIGVIANYVGKSGGAARRGYTVRVKAEARGGRFVVEALGRNGKPVLFTIKRENLAPLQPSLFDE